MKKVIYSFLAILMVGLLFPYHVFAQGSMSVSTTYISINQGGSASFTINPNNSAGRVDIYSSNAGVASVSTGSAWVEGGPTTVTVTGRSAGTATITVKLADVATFDGDDLSDTTYRINVSVNAPAPPPSPSPSPSPRPSPSPSPSPSTSPKPSTSPTPSPNPKTGEKSKDNSLKSLKVNDKDATKVNDTTYTLKVASTVDKINIKAVANDSKAKVTGAGEKQIKDGDNKFTITVTAEDGTAKAYTLTVTREKEQEKETPSLDNLEEALKLPDETIELNIGNKDTVTKAELKLIKDSKKNIVISKLDDDDEVIYSWYINGEEIDTDEDLDLELNFDPKDEEALLKAMNNKKGNYVEVITHKKLKGIELEIALKGNYNDGDKLFLYQYINGKAKLLEEGIEVENGKVRFHVDEGGEYYFTLKDINEVEEVVKESSNKNIFIFVGIGVVVLLILFLLIKKGKKKDKVVEEKKEEIVASPIPEMVAPSAPTPPKPPMPVKETEIVTSTPEINKEVAAQEGVHQATTVVPTPTTIAEQPTVAKAQPVIQPTSIAPVAPPTIAPAPQAPVTTAPSAIITDQK